MKHTLLSLMIGLGCSQVQVGAGIGSAVIDVNTAGIENPSFTLVFATIGYELPLEADDLVLRPYLTIGSGSGAHEQTVNLTQVSSEINSFSTIGLDFVKGLNENFNLIGGIGYTTIDAEVKLSGFVNTEASDTDSELGFKLGVGYDFTDNVGLETYVQFYDSATFASIEAKYTF